jgi:hypothetical protein
MSLWLLYLLLACHCLSQKRFQENVNICFVVLYCIISSYTCLTSCTNCTPSLSYLSTFGHYLQFGYFTLLDFRYFETESRLQKFSRAIFLNTWVKINITQVKYILFQRKVGIRAGNGGRGRCSCPERNSVYLPILKHK